MITSINGSVIDSGSGFVTVDLNGLGMRVEVPNGTRSLSFSVGEIAFLHTAFIVREDSMTLYGFATKQELEVFHHLLTVTGVGPRSAMGILSTLSPGEIAVAATTEDDKAFRTVSGIGPKTAKLLIINLSGKLKHLVDQRSNSETASKEVFFEVDEVLLGLTGLGWPELRARQAILEAEQLMRDSGEQIDQRNLLRKALSLLQSKRPGHNK